MPGWVEYAFHQANCHTIILRQTKGMTQGGIGPMPQVCGGLAWSDG